MKLTLSQYPEDVRIDVRYDYAPRELDVDFVDLEHLDRLNLVGEVEKSAETLQFSGQLSGEIKQVCGRCLKEVFAKINLPFRFFFDIKGADTIDATDEIRELLILNHPISFVCSESCKGLCPKCGIDLNDRTCNCKIDSDTEKSSFANLKEMWQKKKKG